MWQAFVIIKNYGEKAQTIPVQTEFAGTQFARRTLAINPGETRAIEYNFVTNVAGELKAKLTRPDALASDDAAALYLPRDTTLRVAVYTSRPELLSPLLSLNPRLSAKILKPEQYVPRPDADAMILDRFSPAIGPAIPSLWIQPPSDRSPVPIKAIISQPFISTWNSQGQLTAGLRARELPVADAEVFETFEGDTPVASAPEGAIIVARHERQDVPQLAAIGFDPFSGALRFRVTTPLLIANLLRWLRPEAFQHWEISARQVGAATLPLERDEESEQLRVVDEHNLAVPFAIRNHTLQFFVSHPSVIRIFSEHHQRVLSLTLPDVAAYEWKTSSSAAEGVPAPRLGQSSLDLWKWLALVGALGLFVEWMLFGPGRRRIPMQSRRMPNKGKAMRERERELVSK